MIGDFSARQLACLRLLAAGKTNKQIAIELKLSPTTVSAYLKVVYRKMGTKTRTHAVAVAIREGVIEFGLPVNATHGDVVDCDGWLRELEDHPSDSFANTSIGKPD